MLDVIRHSERSERSDEASALTPRGIDLARAFARSAPDYALVLASPAARARQTAEIIGGRVDAIEADLAPDLSAVLSWERFQQMSDLREVARFLAGSEGARRFAADHIDRWARFAGRAREDARVLAVSHGGFVDLVATAIADRVGARLDGRPFAYCEGVRVRFRGSDPVGLEALRLAPPASSSTAE